MKKSAWTYTGYYLLVYLVLAIIYGLAQKHFVCIKIDGYECNFNETKFIGFLTIVAYIITPIVAIVGFISWKEQHNAKLYYDLGSEVLNKLKIFTINLTSFLDLSLNSYQIKVFKFNSNEEKENAIKEAYNKYIKLRGDLMESKMNLINDITFLSYIKGDHRLLENTLNQLEHVDDQLRKFDKYILKNTKNTLNEDELIEFIKNDADIFIKISQPIITIIMNDLKEYIKQ